MAETKRLKILYEKKIKDLEELKKNILQKAFNRELSGPEMSDGRSRIIRQQRA